MKKIISVVLVCILLSGCSSAENDHNSKSRPSSKSSSTSEPSWFDIMRNKIYLYLYEHNEISKHFKAVTIEGGEHGVHFNVTLDAYETYTFAAVTSATVDIVGKLVAEEDIKEFQIQVSSPLDAKYFVSWKATDLNGGILADNGPDGRTGYYTLEKMLENYGYEDFEGKLEDFLESKKIPEELIAPFQGEWKRKKLNSRLIISGESVNFVHYGILNDEDKVKNVYTFYFALNSENELIVVNPSQQPRYLLTINENNELIKYSINKNSQINIDDEPEAFIRVSDNTSVPIPN